MKKESAKDANGGDATVGDEPPVSPTSEKKEKVLHTRISGALDEELRKKANKLGISVSNLVRNALLNSFGLVEDIIFDSAQIARSAHGEETAAGTEPSRAPRGEPTILGWQELVLNVNAVCHSCNAILTKGSKGAVAVVDPAGAHRPTLCPTCLAALGSD